MTTMSLTQRAERATATGVLGLPAALLRILAGRPVVLDGQTLDVQTQLLLRMQRVRGQGALGGNTPAQERRLMDAQCRVLEPGAAGAIATRDLRLAGGDGRIGGRCYRPAACGRRAPALVFYHGGGFVLGSLASHDGVCRALAERAECVVVAVDYRLAPEHPAPAPAQDAIAAFRDIAARAEELDIDSAKIAVSGDSAGGNLAALVAQHARGDDVSPCYQCLFYPKVDYATERESMTTFAQGFLLEKASMEWFNRHYIPADMDLAQPGLSPLFGDLAGLAPALVVTAGFDPLRDEGEAYAQAMRVAGVAATTRRQAGMIHGFLNIAGPVRGAEAALNDAADTLARALHAAKPATAGAATA